MQIDGRFIEPVQIKGIFTNDQTRYASQQLCILGLREAHLEIALPKRATNASVSQMTINKLNPTGFALQPHRPVSFSRAGAQGGL